MSAWGMEKKACMWRDVWRVGSLALSHDCEKTARARHQIRGNFDHRSFW